MTLRGENHPRAVLTHDDVVSIRRRRRLALQRHAPRAILPAGHPDGYPQLAVEFGVSLRTLYSAVNRETWTESRRKQTS